MVEAAGVEPASNTT